MIGYIAVENRKKESQTARDRKDGARSFNLICGHGCCCIIRVIEPAKFACAEQSKGHTIRPTWNKQRPDGGQCEDETGNHGWRTRPKPAQQEAQSKSCQRFGPETNRINPAT